MAKRFMASLLLMAVPVFMAVNAAAGPGKITTNITPADAVAAGAQWTYNDNTTWYNSGATVEGLEVGSYEVKFKDVPNWTTATSKTFSLTNAKPAKVVSSIYTKTICRFSPPFPAQGSLDFCAIVGDSASGSNNIQASLKLVKGFLDCEDDPEYCALVDNLKCSIVDINGPIVDDLPTPNGLLDAQAELALIARVYNTPGMSLPSGLTSDMVKEALVANYTLIYDLVFTALSSTGYCGILGAFPDAANLGIHLSILLAGFATQGDADSQGALLMIAGLLEQISVPPPNPDDFNTLGDGLYFGPNGDLDADGCTNRQEYEAYAAGGTNCPLYIDNALNPAVHPDCGPPAEGEGEILPEGEGEILPEGEGEILPEGEGEILPEGEGPAEGEIEGPAEGVVEGSIEGEGEDIIEQNETAVRTTLLCAIFNAEWAFYSKTGAFTGTFDELTRVVALPYFTGPEHKSNGYIFTLRLANTTFTCNADPEIMNETGRHGYFIDKTGVIKEQLGAPADFSSLESGSTCAITVEGEPATEGAPEGETVCHTADLNCDSQIDLTDLLRVIQLYNNPEGFHCDAASLEADGYSLGPGDMTSCSPHASDYKGGAPDWKIDLSELLRLIQFFHLGGYHSCAGTEDGYCPGRL